MVRQGKMHTLALKTAFYFWLNKMFQVDPNSISGKGENWLHPCFAAPTRLVSQFLFLLDQKQFPWWCQQSPMSGTPSAARDPQGEMPARCSERSVRLQGHLPAAASEIARFKACP